jgi:hypothetical protein
VVVVVGVSERDIVDSALFCSEQCLTYIVICVEMVGAGGPLPAEAKTEESIISGLARNSQHTPGVIGPQVPSS